MGPLESSNCSIPGRNEAETLPVCMQWEESGRRNQNVSTHQTICSWHSRAPCRLCLGMGQHIGLVAATKKRFFCRLFVLLVFQDVTQNKVLLGTLPRAITNLLYPGTQAARPVEGQLLTSEINTGVERRGEMCITLLMMFCLLRTTFPDNKPLTPRNHSGITFSWNSVLEGIPGGHSRSVTNTRSDRCFCV